MKRPVLAIASLLLVGFVPPTHAQTPLIDLWPAPPKFDLSAESDTAKRMARDYDMSEKSFINQPNQSISGLSNLPACGEKALELFKTPAAIQGRIMLASSFGQYLGYGTNVLGVVRVGGSSSLQSQVFYSSRKAKTDLRDLSFAPNGKSVLIKAEAGQAEDYEMLTWEMEASRFSYLHNPNVTAEYKSEVGKKGWLEPRWSPGGRYLAYIRNVGVRSIPGPMYFPTLCVFDTKTNREYRMARFIPIYPDSFSWTLHGQLIFSAGYLEGETAAPSPVYVIDVQSGARTKLFEHGRVPEESPDGCTVAFYDWSATNGVPNKEQGLFLWDKTSQARRFIAPLSRAAFGIPTPAIQWSSDSQNLYVVERDIQDKTQPIYRFYKMAMADKRLQKLAEIRQPNSINTLTLKSHGLSPDGSRLYYEWREIKNEPKAVPNEQYTLFAIDVKSGEVTNIARLNNKGMEFSGWDWYDDSGVNPAFVAAEKFERALSDIKSQP